MAVSSTPNRVVLQGNGSSVGFAFPYYFFSQADLVVNLYDTIAGSSILQTLNSNYTVSGTPSSAGLYPSGANIIFASSVVATSYVVIERNPVQTQGFNVGQSGIIPSQGLNQQFDYLTLLIQRQQDQNSRSLQLPDGDGSGFNTTLPPAMALNPNAAILINPTGTGLSLGAVQLLGSSAPSSVVGVVPVANGGTGVSVAPNPFSVVTGNGTGTAYSSTGTPQFGVPLMGQGSSAPLFLPLNLASAGITGVLPEANGGTGVGGANYTQFGLVYASSATQLSTLIPGQFNSLLVGQGSSAPTFQSLTTQFGFSGGIATPTLLGSSVTMPTATLLQNGSLTAPSLAFLNDPMSGFYRPGAKEIQLGLSGVAAFDMFMINSSAINFGFGTAAATSTGNALSANYTYSGAAIFQYANLSTNAAAQTVFYIGSGPSGANGITMENNAYLSTAYYGGGGLVSAGPNLNWLNLMSEASTGYITFGVGGRAAINEKVRITATSVVHNNGVSITLTGSSANTVQYKASSVGSSSTLIVNTGGGAAGSVWTNDGSNNVSWQPPGGQLIAPTKTLLTTLGSGTYTAPAGAKWLKLYIIGGGGGGGGCSSTAAQGGGGGGGGGGAQQTHWIANSSAVTYQASYIIGSGGPGGSAGNNAGISGSSTVYAVYNAGGGVGGGGSGTVSGVGVMNVPSAGGSASGGANINNNGYPGTSGFVLLGTSSAIGGIGGLTDFGSPGSGSVNGNAGGSGSGYGYGGNGGTSVNGGAAQSGGAGASGIIIIEEFYQ
jgi:hypothetical protein